MTAPQQKKPAEQYRLAFEPDGRSLTVRENVVDILERELLGPANGPDEVLDGPPDVAYLVGRIAPYKLAAGKENPSEDDEGEAATDVGDAVDAEASRGVPVTGVDESGAGADEDDVDDQPQQRGLMIPASMGLRCQIPNDLDAFTVTASWGTYDSIKDPTGENKNRRYRRTPIEITKTITVGTLTPGETTAIKLKDNVTLRIDRFDDIEAGKRLIEIALCNDRVSPRKIPVNAWLFQTKLLIESGGREVFLPVSDRLTDTHDELDDELRRLELQYRDKLEFAVGRTCSVDWTASVRTRRASAVWTTWLPTVQTPQTTAEEIESALLDMRKLETASPAELRAGLEPIVRGYQHWLDGQLAEAEALPAHLRDDGVDLVAEAQQVQRQLSEGLDFLLANEEALRCFRFMNRVMADQRVHSQIAAHRGSNPRETIDQAEQTVLERGPSAHSWRTFQLAFVLMQLPMLTDPAVKRRSGADPKAQLLFFPTGGGKTEAYLGLAAYTFAIRRRQGILSTPDGPLDGGGGVAVLMRYTLRLLTSQQFQRATTLVCAAELARLDDVATWGTEPFRIGLWVGTDVSPKRAVSAAARSR